MTVDTRLRIGDDVVLQGIAYRLTGLDGDVALLSAAGEPQPLPPDPAGGDHGDTDTD